MTIQQLPVYTGEIPALGQEQSQFNTNVSDKLAYDAQLVPAQNVYATEANALAAQVQSDTSDAESSAAAAASNANFKGNWSDATGASNIPASYRHNGKNWQQLQDIADITAQEPSENSFWTELSNVTESFVQNTASRKNELLNSNFLTPSPDAITHPNPTPESYVAGTQIFSGVYAGGGGCTITLIDGRVNCTAGDYQFKVPNTGGLERVPEFTSSVSDYDGIPKEAGVSHALVGVEYVVTVTPAAGGVFSVKFEQGRVATRHELQSAKGRAYTFNTVDEMVAIGAPVGAKVQWLGYYEASDGGSNWGVVKSGVHTEDGGSIFSIDSNTYIEANTRGKRVNVRKFGAVSGDSTTSFAVAMEFARTSGQILKIPADSSYYLITDTLQWLEGVQIEGQTLNQYPKGFGIEPIGSKIRFAPTTQKSLFVQSGLQHSGFRLHYAMKKVNLIADNTNADIGLDINGSIYGSYHTVTIDGFRTGISCDSTIMNSFTNVHINDSSVSAVSYEGNNETTDVWSRCTFFTAPKGVDFKGSSISVRFKGCNFEQIDNYGIDISRECQSIFVDGCYGEDVPFSTSQPDAAMFRVGVQGVSTVTANHLIVNGGGYAGRNAGIHGSLLYVDHNRGTIFGNLAASRYTSLIKTTANTDDDSIALNPIKPLSITTLFNDMTKLNGSIPHSAVGAAGNETRARYPVVFTDEIRPSTGSTMTIASTNITLSGAGGNVSPSVDNSIDIGLGNLRVKDLRIVNAPIVGSDARIKYDIGSIPQNLCDFAMSTEIMQYKLKGGQSGRFHYGIVISEDFIKHLTSVYSIDDCAAFCHDYFEDDDGNPIECNFGDAKLGEIWQVRYSEWQNILLEAIRRKFNTN